MFRRLPDRVLREKQRPRMLIQRWKSMHHSPHGKYLNFHLVCNLGKQAINLRTCLITVLFRLHVKSKEEK